MSLPLKIKRVYHTVFHISSLESLKSYQPKSYQEGSGKGFKSLTSHEGSSKIKRTKWISHKGEQAVKV